MAAEILRLEAAIKENEQKLPESLRPQIAAETAPRTLMESIGNIPDLSGEDLPMFIERTEQPGLEELEEAAKLINTQTGFQAE